MSDNKYFLTILQQLFVHYSLRMTLFLIIVFDSVLHSLIIRHLKHLQYVLAPVDDSRNLITSQSKSNMHVWLLYSINVQNISNTGKFPFSERVIPIRFPYFRKQPCFSRFLRGLNRSDLIKCVNDWVRGRADWLKFIHSSVHPFIRSFVHPFIVSLIFQKTIGSQIDSINLVSGSSSDSFSTSSSENGSDTAE